MQVEADFPAKLSPLFGASRYKVAEGGRGSAKSWGIARYLLIEGANKKHRFLCTREIQKTIKDSVHKLLTDQIDALKLGNFYEHTEKAIRGVNGTEFIFAGLRSNVSEIKSLEGVTKVWVEEAEKVSETSWRTLIPTIRTEGSEIIVSFNPDLETDPTSQRFIVNSPPDCVRMTLNWRDNPFFPEVLKKEKDYDFKVDLDAALHVWEGQFRRNSKAQIFAHKTMVEAFDVPYVDQRTQRPWGQLSEAEQLRGTKEPAWMGPYFGADWGFSVDPDTLVKMWVHERKLYIEHEAYRVGVDVVNIPALWDEVPGSKDHVVRCDSARPEIISHMQKAQYGALAAVKWAGSVEEGVRFLRSFEMIVIHPRCQHAQKEAQLYSYKTDPVTGDVLPIIADKHNHIWDAVRYGMQPFIYTPEEDLQVSEQMPMEAIDSELDDAMGAYL